MTKNRDQPESPSPWRGRGYLPHFEAEGVQALTFRLADSLPKHVVEEMDRECRALPEGERRRALAKRVAAWLDLGRGSCCLREPRCAKIVEDALLHFDGDRYRLLAWCVMPNHVHVIIETQPPHTLDKIFHSWKSFTSKAINKVLKRQGRLWQPEYFDRYVRNRRHYLNAMSYVEQNPVAAGLVTCAADWPWSSAWRREGLETRPEL